MDLRDLAETFKALSDETRLQIVGLLLEQEELCVCDFVGALGLSQSKASRHLRYLYHSGLVEDRREGLWIHYRISRQLPPEKATVVEACRRALGERRLEELRRRLNDWLEQKGGASSSVDLHGPVTHAKSEPTTTA